MAIEFENIEPTIENIKKLYDRTHDGDQCIELLERLTREEIVQIQQYFSKNNPQIFVAINENIVLFEDLAQLNIKGVRLVMDEVGPKILGLALRLGKENLRETILNNSSRDEKELIVEILEGPGQKRSDVEAAIMRIMKYVRPLVKSGKLNIVGGQDPGLSTYV